MIKIVLIFLSSLLLLSYDDFLSDGNNSDYVRLNHIINTDTNKIYLAVGFEDEAGTDLDLVEIDASGPNVLIKKIEDITADFKISKFLALKDEENNYNGEFVLAGQTPIMAGDGRLEHFTYSAGTFTAKSDHTYSSVHNILDIVQQQNGGNLYFVSNKDTIIDDHLDVTDTGIDFEDAKTIYKGYLNIVGGPMVAESYLAEINKSDVSYIIREFSYNLSGTDGENTSTTVADTFFTLGFDSEAGDITIIGSTPVNNVGSKLVALSVNASNISMESPVLKFPALIPPKYRLIVGANEGDDVSTGSTAIYGPVYNESNLEQVIVPPSNNISLPSIPGSDKMVRDGNIDELFQGYYNVSLEGKYAEVINWIDVNCTKQDPPEKYLLPWTKDKMKSVQGLIKQRSDRQNYDLCIENNDKFIYRIKDDNETRIRRQWQFIYKDDDDISPVKWKKDIPNDKIIGRPLNGRIETITTDNTSMIMISQGNKEIAGINLLRIIDSTPGIEDRIKWHKTYRTGQNVGNNESRVNINGPNLLKTIANDFLITGKARDLTRTDSDKFDCMVIKFDKNGNEIWTRNLGGFHDDDCYSVVLEKNNTSPFYNDYIAVGDSGTRNPDDPTDSTSYAVKFRDEGTLIHMADGWSLIANGTDRNITAQGKKENTDTMGIINLGAYKSYFQFINNQWLINQYPIEPSTGFWVYTVDGRHDIFLEGNLIEQRFGTTDLGWVLLGTGVQLIKAQQKFNLNALWKFKEQRWIENPIVINPGEGFWAKKKR